MLHVRTTTITNATITDNNNKWGSIFFFHFFHCFTDNYLLLGYVYKSHNNNERAATTNSQEHQGQGLEMRTHLEPGMFLLNSFFFYYTNGFT